MDIQDKNTALTRLLLAGGVIAGPLYLCTALIQGLLREGFDFSRHSISLLSNGEYGWIQTANFLVSGLLVIGGAAGMRRALLNGRGRIWGPALIALYGIGLIGAGIFRADPAAGFPPGTPVEANTVTGVGMLHFASGGIGFLALVAACFVFASRFVALSHPGWAAYSASTGIVFFAAFTGIAAGSGQTWSIAGFWFGLTFAWVWLSAIAGRLLRGLSRIESLQGGYSQWN